ncbi:hypothetical protein VE01_09466 [Pseudogymnoascus verrucosus]|uniref:Uncharacterized protein n=1 Tax=Pseudogymnoascus verrucosus TaxID=342668 RepID=A0A1B8G9T2_9PEZI|nr:uncharacterized protein VE01_09466 [Pseudogymnoascus verrucosus]OBT92537.2 hypothetical protein VE01_09466 [Pseudogymnoascus verrucosus]
MPTRQRVNDTNSDEPRNDINYRIGLRDNRKRKREFRPPLGTVDNESTYTHRPPSSKRQRVAIGDSYPRTKVAPRLDTILRALRCDALSSIHPAAYVRDNRIIIPSVSTQIYECARLKIPVITGSKRIRLEHSSSKASSKKCELIITMPTKIHEVMKALTSDIKDQMFARDSSGRAFVPATWQKDRVLETGSSTLSLAYNGRTFKFEPDSSLAFEPNNPFLVLEVAVTQDPVAVKKKAHDYIRGSRGKVAFVVVIIVRRLRRRREEQAGDQGNANIMDGHNDFTGQATNSRLKVRQHGNDEQSEPPDHSQARESTSPISTLTDPPSDLSRWSVFPERNLPAKQVSLPSTSLHGTENSGISLPPLLYECLDTNDILNPNDTVHVSVFKSATVPSSTPATAQQTFCTVQPLIEEVEVYPRNTNASFTLAWTDIAKTAPSGGRPSLHISLKPLSRLAQRLTGDGRAEWGDDGFSPLSSGVEEYLVTSSSVEIDHERSGGTVPSSVEKRQDPNFSL